LEWADVDLERRHWSRVRYARTVHILRHAFCSHLTMRRTAMPAVQELVGHQDLTMTHFLQA
jgi:site-specific recombinase XerD